MRSPFRRVPRRVSWCREKFEDDGGHQEGAEQRRRHEPPRDLPIGAGSGRKWSRLSLGSSSLQFRPLLLSPHTRHSLNVVRELAVSVDVHDADDLDEGDEGESHGAVAVEQREPVFARTGCED